MVYFQCDSRLAFQYGFRKINSELLSKCLVIAEKKNSCSPVEAPTMILNAKFVSLFAAILKLSHKYGDKVKFTNYVRQNIYTLRTAGVFAFF